MGDDLVGERLFVILSYQCHQASWVCLGGQVQSENNKQDMVT